MAEILIVEDDTAIQELLQDIIKTQTDYNYTACYSGTEALLLLKENNYDLILLDLMLPGLSGEEVLEQIKNLDNTGVVVLSAKSELEDKVKLLRMGADDYLTKPFETAELLARIESVLRRYQPLNKTETNSLSYKELTLDTKSYQAYFAGQPIHLTSTEFDILKVLIQDSNKVFTRENLFYSVWEDGVYVEDNAINVHISNIRKKISQFTDELYIETVWGIGFKMA